MKRLSFQPRTADLRAENVSYLDRVSAELDGLDFLFLPPTREVWERTVGPSRMFNLVTETQDEIGSRRAREGLRSKGIRISEPTPDAARTSVSKPTRLHTAANTNAQACPGLRRRKVPKRWTELNDRETVYAWHAAIKMFSTAAAFTLNLSPEIERKAKGSDSAATFLLKAINRNLRRVFGRDRTIHVYFVLEEADRHRRLHVHGALTVEPREEAKARQALRAAAGEWEKHRQFQAHTKSEPDEGWVTYSTKSVVHLIKGGVVDRLKGRRISGDPIAASLGLRQEAKRIYEAKRTEAMKARSGNRRSVLVEVENQRTLPSRRVSDAVGI